MKQTDRVLSYMVKRGSITQAEAYEQLGVARLGARIWDLKHQGHRIISSREEGVNRYGEAIRYARYALVRGSENG